MSKQTIKPIRIARLPEGIEALTATARGKIDSHMVAAAQSAFGELFEAIKNANRLARITTHLSLLPDRAQGPNDPHCRFIAGVVFGYDLVKDTGRSEIFDLPLTGSVAWYALQPGRYAVFLHSGPYTLLHHTWGAIYSEWLPQSDERAGPAPMMEVNLNDPNHTEPADLLCELWLPLV